MVLGLLVSLLVLRLPLQDGEVIREVVLEGETRVRVSTLKTRLRTAQEGKPFRWAEADQDRKDLYERFAIDGDCQGADKDKVEFRVAD